LLDFLLDGWHRLLGRCPRHLERRDLIAERRPFRGGLRLMFGPVRVSGGPQGALLLLVQGGQLRLQDCQLRLLLAQCFLGLFEPGLRRRQFFLHRAAFCFDLRGLRRVFTMGRLPRSLVFVDACLQFHDAFVGLDDLSVQALQALIGRADARVFGQFPPGAAPQGNLRLLDELARIRQSDSVALPQQPAGYFLDACADEIHETWLPLGNH
jgi:hypothetical protein